MLLVLIGAALPAQPFCCRHSYPAVLCHAEAPACLELAGDSLGCALLHSVDVPSGSGVAYSHFLLSANPLITTPALVPEQAVHIHSVICLLTIYPITFLDVSKSSQSRITEHTGKEGRT